MKRPLIVILGPTASGKTSFSLEVGEFLERGAGRKVEIINADSRQLYKGLDIGTAKIRDEEMRGIPHYLLSVRDPREKVTVGWYAREAWRVIDAVHARGGVPLLVGGSMLYISAVVDGYVFSGRGGKSVKAVPYDVHVFGILRSQEALHRRMRERIAQQFQSGWISEVQCLIERGYTVNDPGIRQTIGYREIMEWIQRSQRILESDVLELTEIIACKTRKYAKRQMTWWRRDNRILWLSEED